MRQTARRIGIAALGSAILAIGVVMVVTPGPAVLVIPAGLGVLAWEFEWARALRDRARAWLVERRGR